MSKFVVCAVRDRALDAYTQPFVSPSMAGAKRAFANAVNEKGSPMNVNPEDYDLYHLGEWDDKSGIIGVGGLVDLPTMVQIGKECIRKE